MATNEDFAFSSCFSLKTGYMYCDNVRIKTIQDALSDQLDQPSPCVVYSESRIRENVGAYLEAVEKANIPCLLGYAVKANYNPAILSVMKDNGCVVVTVSGNEVKLALRTGFSAECVIYNGNGKQSWETELAVRHGCIINIDSGYDLRHIAQEARKQRKTARVFLRVNPDIDPRVHDFIATGCGKSKFGVPKADVACMLDDIAAEPLLNLLGLHCHLGSTIDDVNVFRTCVDVMLEETTKAKQGGRFPHLKYLNLGGGLGIDYRKHAARTCAPDSRQMLVTRAMPTPNDLLTAVSERLIDSGLTLVLEPGRSLVGDTAILVSKVTGCKRNGNTNYIVVDAAMTELIRPSLYSAYHHIEPTEPFLSHADHDLFNVVGPVCESTDVMGKERYLPHQREGAGLAVFDVGAYGSCMASNYNMRCRPAEVMVSGDNWRIIRKPDSVDDLLRPFTDLPTTATLLNGEPN